MKKDWKDHSEDNSGGQIIDNFPFFLTEFFEIIYKYVCAIFEVQKDKII